VVAVAIGLLATACGGGSDGSTTVTTGDGGSIAGTGPHDGGTLSIAVASAPTRWSPTTGDWTTSELQAARAVYDTLLERDANDNPSPGLLEKAVASSNGSVWTLTLRPDVLFSDGTPLDAGIVAFALDSQRLSPSSSALLSPIASIATPDASTVVVTMYSPWTTFDQLLTGRIGTIALPATIRGEITTPIGTGPFTYSAVEPDGTVVVVRNTGYWRKGQPHLDAVRFVTIPEAADRVDAVVDGRVGMTAVDEPRQLARIEQLPGGSNRFVIHEDRNAEKPKVSILLDTGRAPFDRISARRAVSYATDRQQILERAFAEQGTIARGIMSDTSPWFTDHGTPTRDLERARREVAEYEAETGEPLTFHLLVPPNTTLERVASLWKIQLAAAGIEVEIDPVDRATIDLATFTGQYQSALGVGFSNAHPDAYEPFFRGIPAEQQALTTNLTRYINPLITRAFADARSTTDATRQLDDYRTLQDQVFVDVPVLFLVQMRDVVLTSPTIRDVGGWSTGSGDPALSDDTVTISLARVWIAD